MALYTHDNFIGPEAITALEIDHNNRGEFELLTLEAGEYATSHGISKSSTGPIFDETTLDSLEKRSLMPLSHQLLESGFKDGQGTPYRTPPLDIMNTFTHLQPPSS